MGTETRMGRVSYAKREEKSIPEGIYSVFNV